MSIAQAIFLLVLTDRLPLITLPRNRILLACVGRLLYSVQQKGLYNMQNSYTEDLLFEDCYLHHVTGTNVLKLTNDIMSV